MFRIVKKLFVFLVLISIAGISIVVIQLFQFQSEAVFLSEPEQIFVITPGSNIKLIAQDLSLKKIIDDPWLFILLAKVKGVETRVRAGEYQLQQGWSVSDLLDVFIKGSSIQYSLSIIEGWSFGQMIHALQDNPVITSQLTGKSNAEIMTILGYKGQHPEGLFFPDTYRFPKGTTDIQFLRRAYLLMQDNLQREWDNRAPGLPITTSYEALILASIIEKETGVAHERPLIAAVFIQRLKKGMRLQTDPTIIYGMGENFDGNIRSRDLKKDTPYNTYLHKGLTPTPIALPGVEAIRAALHPANSDALYFVARGDGTHQFSETLEQHNKAVVKYQLKGRKNRRKISSES